MQVRPNRFLRVVLFIGALIGLAACQPIDVEVNEFEHPATTIEFDESEPELATTTAPQTTVASPTTGFTDDSRFYQNTTGDIETLRQTIPFETAIGAGTQLTVTFPGGAPGDIDSLCSFDHRVEVNEDNNLVEVQVTRLTILVPDASVRDCAAHDQVWAVTTTLAEPVGERLVIDETASYEHRVANGDALLAPTALPEGWVTLRDDGLLPTRTIRYVTPAGEVMVLQIAPIDAGQRISHLREQPGWEPTTVRNLEDGIFLVFRDRRTIVAFEEQGWYYKVGTTSDVDPSVALRFVQSFERANLIETPDPALTARELLDPQPGQEERESTLVEDVQADS